jgi:DNA-binding NarL/FixJ family response regulator
MVAADSPPVAPDGLELVVGVAAAPRLAARLAAALRRDGDVTVTAAPDPVDLAFRFIDDVQPHVAVLASLADLSGGVRLLRRLMPATRIVVVLRERAAAELDAALKLGCDAAVLEPQAPLVLAATVRAVALGQSSVPRDMRAALLGRPKHTRRERRDHGAQAPDRLPTGGTT